jgi:hypothetical protein
MKIVVEQRIVVVGVAGVVRSFHELKNVFSARKVASANLGVALALEAFTDDLVLVIAAPDHRSSDGDYDRQDEKALHY